MVEETSEREAGMKKHHVSSSTCYEAAWQMAVERSVTDGKLRVV
jgi:hypothetical protein